MKAVLISIQPKWCAKIANGEKSIEVRKTQPKIELPFKCYIYCTADAPWLVYGDVLVAGGVTEKYTVTRGRSRKEADKIWGIMNGKVIGEFVCDAILPISVKYSNPNHHIANREFPLTGLTDKQIMDYLGNGKEGYGWHITDLKIYDKPKPLSDFERPCKCLGEYEGETYCDCLNCDDAGDSDYGIIACDRELKKPPQSWCYVEELRDA